MRLPKAVLDRVHRDFAETARAEVEEALSGYGTAPHHREVERVLLDLLQLAGSDVAQVKELVERAKRDYRDIIFWAESPSESRLDSPEKVRAFNDMLRRFGADWRVPAGKKDP